MSDEISTGFSRDKGGDWRKEKENEREIRKGIYKDLYNQKKDMMNLWGFWEYIWESYSRWREIYDEFIKTWNDRPWFRHLTPYNSSNCLDDSYLGNTNPPFLTTIISNQIKWKSDE